MPHVSSRTLTVLDVQHDQVTVCFDPLEHESLDEIFPTESTALQVLMEAWSPHDEHPLAEKLTEWTELFMDQSQWGKLCDIAQSVITDVELQDDHNDAEVPIGILTFRVNDARLAHHLKPKMVWGSGILFLENWVDEEKPTADREALWKELHLDPEGFIKAMKHVDLVCAGAISPEMLKKLLTSSNVHLQQVGCYVAGSWHRDRYRGLLPQLTHILREGTNIMAQSDAMNFVAHLSAKGEADFSVVVETVAHPHFSLAGQAMTYLAEATQAQLIQAQLALQNTPEPNSTHLEGLHGLLHCNSEEVGRFLANPELQTPLGHRYAAVLVKKLARSSPKKAREFKKLLPEHLRRF